MRLPDPDDWRSWSAQEQKTYMDVWQADAGLNFWEVELVAKYLRATGQKDARLFPVYLTVESPRRSDGNALRFNVGYVIGRLRENAEGPGAFSLHYMRIQNHLRKMGLARDALVELRRTLNADIDVSEPLFARAALDQTASDEALPTDDAAKRLRTIIRSLS